MHAIWAVSLAAISLVFVACDSTADEGRPTAYELVSIGLDPLPFDWAEPGCEFVVRSAELTLFDTIYRLSVDRTAVCLVSEPPRIAEYEGIYEISGSRIDLLTMLETRNGREHPPLGGAYSAGEIALDYANVVVPSQTATFVRR